MSLLPDVRDSESPRAGWSWLRKLGRRVSTALLLTGTLATQFLPSEAEAQNMSPPIESMNMPPQGGMGYYGGDPSGSSSILNTQGEDLGVGGYGVKGRVGHEAGQTVGREDSITFFDLSPYVFVDNTYWFVEGRLMVANNGHAGGTAGGGFRQFFPRFNTVGGLSTFYDRDDSRGVLFQQFGVSAEFLTEWLDWRTNFYFPFGDEEEILSTRFENGTQQFVDAPGGIGSNIQFQRRTRTATAMGGFDMMFTAPVPGEIPEMVNFEMSAGFYHFKADNSDIPDAWGWKVRGDADLFNRFSHLFLEVMQDKVFKTNVVFGIDVNYWHKLEDRPRIGGSQYNRLASWVRRNRSVTAFNQSFLEDPELAINPVTDNPYLVYHVRNVPGEPAIIGNGTEDNPFQFIQEGVDAVPPGDIVFVHGNSVMEGAPAAVVLRDNLQVIGEDPSGTLTIPVANLDEPITMPGVTEGPFDRPIIRNLPGPAVTLANGSRFAGIDIENVTGGPAILAPNGTNGSTVTNVDITTTNGLNAHGIRIINGTGAFNFANINMTDVEDTDFLVEGGDANILFDGTNTIDNTEGFAVRILNAAGVVNMRKTLIEDNGGLGIEVSGAFPGDSTANVTFEDVLLTDTNPDAVRPGILIDNHGGNVFFLNQVSIDNNNGDAFVVNDLQPLGAVTVLGSTSIENRRGRGIVVNNIVEGPNPVNPGQNIAGIVEFQGAVSIDEIADGFEGLDPALEFSSSSGTLLFLSNLTIDGGNGNGIEITDIANTGTTAGLFQVQGQTNIDNIAGVSFNIDNIAKQNFTVRTGGINIDDRGGIGINVTNSAGTALFGTLQFAGEVTVGNGADSEAIGINVSDNTGSAFFGNTSVTDVLGVGSFGVRVHDNVNPLANRVSTVSFNSLSVDGQDAIGVSMIGNEDVSTSGGEIDIDGARGIEVIHNLDGLPGASENDGRHTLRFNSISANGADFGIIVDGPGSFIVDGSPGNSLGSGGEIDGMSVAGAQFQNTQSVQLRHMEITDNAAGVIATTLNDDIFGIRPELILNGVEISGSDGIGIDALDVLRFELRNSIVEENGRGEVPLDSRHQIRLIVDEARVDSNDDGDIDDDDDLLQFNYTFDSNTINDGTGAAIVSRDMILIATTRGLDDPVSLNLTVSNHGIPPQGINTITSNRNGAAALAVAWEGDFTGTFTDNTFRLLNGNGTIAGSDQSGLLLDIDGVANVLFDGNALTAEGESNVGLNFNFEERANVTISNNVVRDVNGVFQANSGFVFSGNNSTAISMTFEATNNNVDINTNAFDFIGTTTNGTGILFRRIFGPSNVNIELNLIQMNAINPDVITSGINRGIFFQDVRGTINLSGNQDNQIGPPSLFLLPFFIQSGVSNGSIFVNGAQVP